MGYACPVCETPQPDGEHLANHLAFTAMLRGGDHEAWLDERVSEWEELAPAALADRVADHATQATYDEVFEDTTDEHDHGEGHDHNHGHGHGGDAGGLGTPAGRGDDTAADTEETEQVLAEARRLTAEMHDHGDDAAGDDAVSADAGDGDAAGDDAVSADAGDGDAAGDDAADGDTTAE